MANHVLYLPPIHPKPVGYGHHNIANILGDVSGLYGSFSRQEGCKYGRMFNGEPLTMSGLAVGEVELLESLGSKV